MFQTQESTRLSHTTKGVLPVCTQCTLTEAVLTVQPQPREKHIPETLLVLQPVNRFSTMPVNFLLFLAPEKTSLAKDAATGSIRTTLSLLGDVQEHAFDTRILKGVLWELGER